MSDLEMQSPAARNYTSGRKFQPFTDRGRLDRAIGINTML
jgi:hypothetical protein